MIAAHYRNEIDKPDLKATNARTTLYFHSESFSRYFVLVHIRIGR